MTDLDKQAAAGLVAERIGWTAKKVGRWWRLFKWGSEVSWNANGIKGYPGTSEEAAIWTFYPLFDATPEGALAREEAEEWLLGQGWKVNYAEKDIQYDGQLMYRYVYDTNCRRTYAEEFGLTLAEARATAICNAVRGMREEEAK